jgi:mannan endo-1,4-beta-mannosidase
MDRFYTDVRTRAWYRAHLERLLGRTNSVNGLRYAEDPTILSWELFNESSVTPEGRAVRRIFLQEMARLVRARAPRQLVSAGVTDYARAHRRDEWLAVCSLPEISFCDGHLYPEESLRVQRPEDLLAIIDDRVQLAHHVARKPCVFGEYGFSSRPASERWLGQSEAHWHDVFLGRVHLDGAAGAMPWIYVPFATPERRYAIWTDRAASQPLRRVLRRWARILAAGPPARTNPMLGAARGRRPLYPLEVEVKQAASAALAWRRDAGGWAFELPVRSFVRARFEEVGVVQGGALEHAYGAGPGFFEYRVPASPVRLARLEVWLRASSEFPGAVAPPKGFSWVTVLLGGAIVGRFIAPPDDGMGRGLTLCITDRSALARLSRGPAILRLEVRRGAKSNGLCLYGPQGQRLDPRVQGPVGPVRLIGQSAESPPNVSGNP